MRVEIVTLAFVPIFFANRQQVMGLYDRNYTQYEESDFGRGGNGREAIFGQPGKSITTILIIMNVAAFIANQLFRPVGEDGERISLLFSWMQVTPETLFQPWLWWQYLTYGFAHNDRDIWHLAINMLVLFFFGNTVEQRIGRSEFLRFYLLAVVLGGVVWSLLEQFRGGDQRTALVGASGGVQAVTILFACLYPHAQILLFFVIPVKAWIAAVGFAVLNLWGALGGGGTTAYDVHLVGIAFAAVYHFRGIQLERVLPSIGSLPSLGSRRPRLRLHDPDRRQYQEDQEADRILDKIHQLGEASLTRKERKFMENYSRKKRAQRGG